jgi:hypothetical protein
VVRDIIEAVDQRAVEVEHEGARRHRRTV